MYTKLIFTYWENKNVYNITIYIWRKQQCIRNYYLHIEKTLIHEKWLFTYWENNNAYKINIYILRKQQYMKNDYIHKEKNNLTLTVPIILYWLFSFLSIRGAPLSPEHGSYTLQQIHLCIHIFNWLKSQS